MPHADLAAHVPPASESVAGQATVAPPLSDPVTELRARRSLRRSWARRAGAVRAAARRRRVRTGAVALVGAMTLAGGAAVAQSGGAAAGSSAKAKQVRSGMSGATVIAIQRKLGVAADGAFGPRTRRALKRWQRRNGLVADGVPGPLTLAKMGISAAAPRASETIATRSTGSAAGVLQRIARCESGGNPAAVSANGQYRGKYQFSRATWRRMGGAGDPAKAPEAEQDRIAAKLFAAQGRAPWPHCGRRA